MRTIRLAEIEPIQIVEIRDISRNGRYIFPDSFAALDNSASRRPVMKTYAPISGCPTADLMAATTPSKDLEDITLNRSNFTVVIVFPARNGSFFEAPSPQAPRSFRLS